MYISFVDNLFCAGMVGFFYLLFWFIHLDSVRVKGKKPATLNNFHFLLDILIIFGRAMFLDKTVCQMQKWLLSFAYCLLYLP